MKDFVAAIFRSPIFRIAQITEEKRQATGWLLLQFCVISC